MRLDGRGDAAAFTAFQRSAWSNLVLSVTQRCPLSCRHCITNSTNSAGMPVLSAEQARLWGRELEPLREAGLRHLTFTGGEPTLARAAVRELASAARAAGVATSIVTSGAFARNPAAAERTMADLGDVEHWDCGYDVYHAEHLPLTRFATAVRSARAGGHPVSVRVCLADDRPAADEETHQLLDELAKLCGADVPVVTQSVRRLGRGAGLGRDHPATATPAPCPSSGPLVREDGSVAPCCAGLAYPERSYLPFRFGNAITDGLAAVWNAWREDQTLRVMRLVGLVPIVGWLRADGVSAPPPAGDVCELCTAVWDKAGSAAAAVAARAAGPDIRDRLDQLEERLYGSVWAPTSPVNG